MIISEDYQEILWNMSLRGGMEWNEINQEGKTLTFTDYFTILRPKITAHQPRLRMDSSSAAFAHGCHSGRYTYRDIRHQPYS